MSIASLLTDLAIRVPNKPALCGGESLLTYAALASDARRLAPRLIACGIKPGDRVALHMQNGAEIAIAYFGCFYAGAIAVPLNARMKAPEIEYVVQHSGCSIYLGQSELFQEIAEIRGRLTTVRQFVIDGRWPEVGSDRLATELVATAPDQPAVILYTSGSTARPKGVLHTHRSVRSAALDFARHFRVADTDVVAIVTPMVHSAGFFAWLATVEAGVKALVVPRFDADAVLDAIARHRGTHMFAMPVMYRALITAQRGRPRDISSARAFFAGGDVVPPALQSEFAKCFGRTLHEGYGTTETGLVALNLSDAASRIGSFGRPVPGVEIAVVDTEGLPASAGNEGELLVCSPSNMVGYWNDPVATDRALKAGWYHSGDLVLEDCDGYLWFRGRKKEIIVRGGSNISPEEVEAVLYQHAGVREAGVVGVPDEIWGQRVVAFVSRQSGLAITADELIAFVAERLAAYKTPEEIVFLDDLPKNESGKVYRRALLEHYGVSRSPEPEYKTRAADQQDGPAAATCAGAADTYLPGHHASVVDDHAKRTAETAATFFLPFLKPGMRLLDVGCGPGSITAGLAVRVEPGETIGIDASLQVIETARSLPHSREAKHLSFEGGNIYSPRFGAESFDAVFSHQVLQHLTRPIDALEQMRALLRPGGIVGARAVDWGSTMFYPEDAGILRFLALYYELAHLDGGEPNAGRHLPRWLRQAGFVDLHVSTSAVSYTEAAAIQAWADAYADAMLQSNFAEKAVEHGLATRSDLAAIAAAWRSWSRSTDAFFCFTQTEVVAWKK
jgi:long-chain acyl-CoA synthetase